MNNKWVQLGVAIVLWLYLAKSVIYNVGIFGGLFNRVGQNLFSETLFGVPSSIFLFMIFSIIYAVLGYFAIFFTEKQSKDVL